MALIPSRLTAGDSWSMSIGAAEGGPPWAVSLVLTLSTGGTPTNLPAAWGGDVWDLEVGASVTAAIAAGTYRWSVIATDAAADLRCVIASGAVEILADPASGADPRSKIERDLDAVRAVLADPAWVGAESYAIEGRSLNRRTTQDLLRLEARLIVRLNRERGKSSFRQTLARF